MITSVGGEIETCRAASLPHPADRAQWRRPGRRWASAQLAQVLLRGSLANWRKYLDLAYPTKPADWHS
ncbi:alpha/beta hydrolase, partial [Micromonospora sp. NPDC048843]